MSILIVGAGATGGYEAASGEMAPAVGPDTTVVPVLNGMRHMDILNAAFGTARVLGGVAVIATQLDGNGDIAVLKPDASLTIGAQDRQRTPAVERTHQLLTGAGFPVSISDDTSPLSSLRQPPLLPSPAAPPRLRPQPSPRPPAMAEIGHPA
jgi:2-dehydropantoate 2-reductase